MTKQWQATSITLNFQRKDSTKICKQTFSHIAKDATEEDIRTFGEELAKLDADLTYIGATQTEKESISK